MKTIGMKKAKLLSAFAVLAIAFAVFAAIPAVAEDSDATSVSTLDELKAALTDGNVAVIDSGKTITISDSDSLTVGAGKTLTVNGMLTVNGTLTVAGGEINGTGTINGNSHHPVVFYAGKLTAVTVDASSATGAVVVSTTNTGDITISDVVINVNANSSTDHGIYVNEVKNKVVIDRVVFDFNNTNCCPINTDTNNECDVSISNIVYNNCARENKVLVNATSEVDIGTDISFSNVTDVCLWASDDTSNFTVNGATTISGEFTLYNVDLTVSAKLVINGVLALTENSTVSIESAGSVACALVAADGSEADIFISAGDEGATISNGSITITGELTAAQIASRIAEAFADEAVVLENVTVTGGKLTLDGIITLATDLKVASGAEVKINGTIVDGSTSGTSPKITGVSDSDKGKVTVDPAAEISSVDITIPVVVDESGMETQYVGGTASIGETPYSANQIVQVIDGQDWTLVSGAIVTIKGQLVVPEGSKVIIQDGAQLIINGKVASEIDGVVTLGVDMDEIATSINGTGYYGGILKIDDSTVNFNADVEISGSLVVINKGVANFDANITVSEYGVVASGATETIKVSEVSVMTVNGSMNIAKVSNYGAIVINSAVASASSEIALLKSGAYVDVVRYTVAKAATLASLTITDNGIEIGKLSAVARTNTITIAPMTTSNDSDALFTIYGVKVTESAVIATEGSPSTTKYINNVMDIAGDVKTSASTETESSYPVTTVDITIASTAGSVNPVTSNGFAVSDALTVGHNVTVTVNGEVVVTGTVTAVAKAVAAVGTTPGAGAALFTVGTGKLVLKDTGLVQVPNTNVLTPDNVEAAVYETTIDTTTKYSNYVTVDSALDKVNSDSTVTKVQVLNNQTVTKDNTVPTGVTVTVTYDMNVGTSENRDVTLTIAADAGKITIADGKKIVIYGTLYAENKSKLNTEAQIQSDVKSVQLNEKGVAVKNGWAKFTNLYTAMEEADAGETIAVSTNNLIIDRNLTIKDQVTLAIPETVDAGNVAVTVKDGVTITVNGYIVTQAQLTADSKYATSASTVDGQKSSAFVLGPNGYIAYTDDVGYISTENIKTLANTNIAGAYYQIEIDSVPYNVVSSLEIAIADVEEITSEAITLNGKITAGDVIFTATDVCKEIIVSNKTGTDVKFQSLVLDDSKLTATGGFTGAVTVSDVTVSFVAVKTFNVSDVEDVMTFGVNTAFAASGTEASESSITLVAGTMKASVGSNVKFIVGTGATLEATANYVFVDLVINGTVNVPAGKQLTGTTTTINENGVLSVAPLTATTDKGIFTVTTFNVGIDGTKYYAAVPTGASASVSGPVNLQTVAYVAAGVTIADGTFADSVKSTGFYIGDELWMTVYVTSTAMSETDYEFQDLENKIPVKDAQFNGWKDADGNDLDDEKIGSIDKAIANVKYDVYGVRILSAEGVIDITIDGNLYVPNEIVKLTAGTHKVEYTLDNGWTGTAKLAVNGTVNEGTVCTLDGMNFTISGDYTPETAGTPIVTLQLTGIEKSGFVPDAPDSGDDGGMTITDYLLIILVVLIVVMAIIVAMRLMRS